MLDPQIEQRCPYKIPSNLFPILDKSCVRESCVCVKKLTHSFDRPVTIQSMAMKSAAAVVVLVVAMVAMVAMVGVAEGACPDIDLDSCLPAAEADVDPAAECCAGLTTYTSSNDVTCLCEAAMGTAFFTSNPVDYAILIPQKCGLHYAAGTECGGIAIPGGQ